jgi:outer membrane receptor protein involved in Fe transport
MNQKYTFTLLTLLMVVCFVPAIAQTKSTDKKPAAKTVQKAPAKTTKKPAKATSAQKATAKNLGDAAAKAPVADTTKKGGNNNTADKNGGSLSEEIVVTTAYKPVLAEAVKIRRNPDLEDKTPFKAPLSYAPLDVKLKQDNNIRQLEAMKRPAEQDSALLNNYAKVGIGSLKTTYGEAYFANGRDEALQVGGYIKHLAQSGNDFEKQKDSRQEIGVFGKSINQENTISGRLNYKRRGTYFYGYDLTNPPASFDPAKQTLNTFSAEAELAKNYKDVENDLTYALKLKGYVFSNAYKAKENNIVISGFLNQTVNQFYAGLSGSLDLATQKDSLYSLNNNLLRLNPYIKFQGDNYKIDAGVNIVKEFGLSSRFFIFPAAKVELQIIPRYVRLFAEAKGNVNRTSLNDLFANNAFLGQNLNIRNSVDQLDITLGLKGTLAPGLGFKAAVFRNTVKNLPLLVNNFTNEFNKFTVIYDDGKARISGFTGELDFKASDDVNIFGRVEYKDYKLASELEPWNLPKVLITAGTTIHISNKVDINGSLFFRGATKDRSVITNGPGTTPAFANIASFADVSGGATYKINKQFSVFVQANNLLNSNNKTWLYYPNYGFNIFGGVGYAF